MSLAPQQLARLSGEISTLKKSYHDELAKLRREEKKEEEKERMLGRLEKIDS